MKNNTLNKILFLLILILSTPAIFAQEDNQQIFLLKTYIFNDSDESSRTDDFLENAYLPALKRQDIKHVGVFKPRTYAPKDTLKRTIVLIPFTSLEDFQSLDKQLLADQDFQQEGKEFIEASHDNPPYQRIQSIVLKAFPDMPQLKPSPLDGTLEDRVYELRSYQSPTLAYHQNKVDMFNAGGEVALFDDLGFNAVFYASVLAGPDMPNLMYMVTFKDEASRDAHWEAFGKDPRWEKLSKLPEYQDNVSHIDNYYLVPTEYSDY